MSVLAGFSHALIRHRRRSLVVADVESVRSGVLLMSPFRRDDAMDGIADVGSVVGRVATFAFVRKESVPV